MTFTIWNSAINLVAIVLIAFASRSVWRWYCASRDLAAAERLREAAEQRALGAMLAPHTLHNMLNVVYAATLSSPDRAPALVVRLSEMMRYLVEKGQQDFAAAEDEWRFLEQYRDFAIDRSAAAKIDLRFEGDGDTPVPALMLAGVFENAVKHGADEAGTLLVSAHFVSTDKGFRFVVENKIGVAIPPGTQIGIDLVSQRLALLYPERHRYTSTIDHDNDLFRTEICTW
ncbi:MULTISPECIES: histidine kinase [unclassified Sphingomonas]|uniref:histidine kinase n=1 Tax=unclassified Sphingomonas TaxID=196159 RepID=UPI0035A974F6